MSRLVPTEYQSQRCLRLDNRILRLCRFRAYLRAWAASSMWDWADLEHFIAEGTIGGAGGCLRRVSLLGGCELRRHNTLLLLVFVVLLLILYQWHFYRALRCTNVHTFKLQGLDFSSGWHLFWILKQCAFVPLGDNWGKVPSYKRTIVVAQRAERELATTRFTWIWHESSGTNIIGLNFDSDLLLYGYPPVCIAAYVTYR